MRTKLLFGILGTSFFLLGSGLVFDGGDVYAKHVTPSPVCEKSLEGGLVQCGRSCDDEKTKEIDEHAECGFCSFFYLFQKIVNWIIGRLAPLIALLFVVLGGFLLVTSRGDPKQTSLGKSMVLWTLAGYALILVSWVIVSSVFAWIGVAKWTGLTGGWWQPVCGRAQITTPSPAPTLPVLPPTQFIVQPYIVYPADKPIVPEYEAAVNQLTPALRDWYKEKVGETFTTAPAEEIKTTLDYLTMRCGDSPSDECRDTPSMVAPNAGGHALFADKALKSLAAIRQLNTVAVIFGVGGGGVVGGISLGDEGGFTLVGDWVLEPISGVSNDWGIPCSFAKQNECVLNTAKGTVAHELGHTFGLVDTFYQTGTGHPPAGSKTIMLNHSDYPNIGFLPEEIDFLRKSPFFK